MLPTFHLDALEQLFIGKRLPKGYSVIKVPKKSPKDNPVEKRLQAIQSVVLDSKRSHKANFGIKENWANQCLWIMDNLMKSPLVLSFLSAAKNLPHSEGKHWKTIQQLDFFSLMKKLLKEDYIGPTYFAKDFHSYMDAIRIVASENFDLLSLAGQVEDYFEELYNTIQENKVDTKQFNVTASIEKLLREQMAHQKGRDGTVSLLSNTSSKQPSKSRAEPALKNLGLADLKAAKKLGHSRSSTNYPSIVPKGLSKPVKMNGLQKTLSVEHRQLIPSEVRTHLESYIQSATYDNIVGIRTILSKHDASILQKAEITIYIEDLPYAILEELSNYMSGVPREEPVPLVLPKPQPARQEAARQASKKPPANTRGSSRSSFTGSPF